MRTIIDTHQHFWKFNPDEYGWIGPDQGVLRRDFLPPDLEPIIRSSGVTGVVSVQARQKLEETHWLLELAAAHHFIKGVVGWVPLIAKELPKILEVLAPNPRLKGVRHVLHDEPDDGYMLRDDFNLGISLLERFNLVYDILIFERHLPQAIEFVDRHPRQIFVVDHIAKPRIAAGILEPWRTNIRELAARPNVYCKLSGAVTEADHRSWRDTDLQPYVDVVLECFGPQRLMFGTDWPVCLLASAYARWVKTVEMMIGSLSDDERDAVWSGTAVKVYGLEK
ncbi:MAG: amidohydrolase family protein [Phycisphaerae bacterium]